RHAHTYSSLCPLVQTTPTRALVAYRLPLNRDRFSQSTNLLRVYFPNCHTLYRIHFAYLFFFFQAEDGIRDRNVTGVQTCALPISHLHVIQNVAMKSPAPFFSRCDKG